MPPLGKFTWSCLNVENFLGLLYSGSTYITLGGADPCPKGNEFYSQVFLTSSGIFLTFIISERLCC